MKKWGDLDAKSVETSVLMSTSVECMISSKPKSLISFLFYDVYYSGYLAVCRVVFDNLTLDTQKMKLVF